MSYTFEEGKDRILEEVVSLTNKKLDTQQAVMCAEFVRQCFGTVALDDLRLWTAEGLCGAAIHFWSTIQTRCPHETKIIIYNPDEQQDGWQTSHTVIEVITDDAPFLVDSMRMVIHRMGLASHLIIHMGGIRLTRGDHDQVTAIFPRRGELSSDVMIEAPIFMEIDRHTDAEVLTELQHNLQRVLVDNHAVAQDWQAMRQQIQSMVAELNDALPVLDATDVEETKLFLQWIEDHHFTFLGVRDYALLREGNEMVLQAIPDTGLGVLREEGNPSTSRNMSVMPPEARELSLSSQILVMSKTNTLATVH